MRSFNTRRIFAVLFLISNILLAHLKSIADGYITRRARDIGLYYSLIQNLKSGIQDEVNNTFSDGDYEIHIWGKHLSPVTETGVFSYPTAFLSIKIAQKGRPIGYYIIYPTNSGYKAEFSAIREKGKFINLGNLASLFINETKDSFGIIMSPTERFNPTTFSQLEARLAPYLYTKNINPSSSELAAFIQTVDELKADIEVSASTVGRILTNNGEGNFSQYGYYYWIAKHYPGGLETLHANLNLIKQNGFAQGKGMEEIEKEMVQHIKENVPSREQISNDVLLGFLFAAGILSTSDYRNPTLKEVLEKGGSSFITLEQAEERINSDIQKGILGWVGVLDLDQLRLINTIYSKPIVNFILKDIKRVFNYFLSSRGGFAFAYRSGDEIGIYLPVGNSQGIKSLFTDIRKYLADIRYDVFELGNGISQEELTQIQAVLNRYDAFISEERYGGKQIGIVRYGNAPTGNKLFKMIGEIGSQLGRTVTLQRYLGGQLSNVLVPTFSGGIISLGNVEEGDLLKGGFYRAQDTLGEAKREGRDKVILGYNGKYRHKHTGEHLISDELSKEIDKFNISPYPPSRISTLTPRIYNESSFREEIYQQISEGKQGLLLCLAPTYDGENGLHYINETYTLQGGDDVIKLLGYLEEIGFKQVFGKDVLLGRRIDRVFVFIPEISHNYSVYEKIVRIVSEIGDKFTREVPIDVRFDIYGAFVEKQDADNPGLLFQHLDYTENEDNPWIRDLWGNSLSIYGVDTESQSVTIEREMVQEALKKLVMQILESRIFPRVTAFNSVQELVREDLLLRNINWDFISRIIENRVASP